jgi:3-methyl-2-oxobutanoate hydroxymethyltransferase
MKKTLQYLQDKKTRGEKITMLTCYDYPTARLEDEAGVDIIFVGDSVGTNVLGYDNEREVSMDDMLHHLRAVRRGVETAYLLVDMPYGTTDTPEQALSHARTFLEHGADGVKIEGPKKDVVRLLHKEGIQVCSHLGLTPQTETKPGFQAKTAQAAVKFSQQVLAMQEAGASLILFETIPEEVAKLMTEWIEVPSIGIGAGRHTDGQVLVVLDLLGWSPFNFRHNRKYDDFRGRALSAFHSFVKEVGDGRFPGEGNLRHMAKSELEEFTKAIGEIQTG